MPRVAWQGATHRAAASAGTRPTAGELRPTHKRPRRWIDAEEGRPVQRVHERHCASSESAMAGQRAGREQRSSSSTMPREVQRSGRRIEPPEGRMAKDRVSQSCVWCRSSPRRTRVNKVGCRGRLRQGASDRPDTRGPRMNLSHENGLPGVWRAPTWPRPTGGRVRSVPRSCGIWSMWAAVEIRVGWWRSWRSRWRRPAQPAAGERRRGNASHAATRRRRRQIDAGHRRSRTAPTRRSMSAT